MVLLSSEQLEELLGSLDQLVQKVTFTDGSVDDTVLVVTVTNLTSF